MNVSVLSKGEDIASISKVRYAVPIQQFTDYCHNNGGGIPTHLGQLVSSLVWFFTHMTGETGPWNEDSRIKSARSALKYMVHQDHGAEAAEEVFAQIPTTHFTEHASKVENPYRKLFPTEIETIQEMNTDDFYDHRDQMLILLHLEYALAPREIIFLNAKSFDYAGAQIHISSLPIRNRKKSISKRTLPMREEFMEQVLDYYDHMFDYANDEDVALCRPGPLIVGPPEALENSRLMLPPFNPRIHMSEIVKRTLIRLGLKDYNSIDLRDHCLAEKVEQGYDKDAVKEFRGLQGLFRDCTL